MLVGIVGGSAYALNWWVNTSAFLAEEDGVVAVYQGVPGTFAGLSFNHLDHKTTVNVDDLNPGLAARIAERSITTDSVQAADDLVAQYKDEINTSKQTNTAQDTSTQNTNTAQSSNTPGV